MSNSAAYLIGKKVTRKIWDRGGDYFARGEVELVECTSRSARAIVHGTEPYYVKLELAGGGIRQSCTCPYFVDVGFFCKHLVAVALAWDKHRGIEIPVDVAPPIAVEFGPRLTRRQIEKLFDFPLNCELDYLRILPEATALGGRGRPHSELPLAPKALKRDPQEPVTLQELKLCFQEMRKWAKRKKFDPYFCSGEMIAAFCEVIRSFRLRLDVTDPMVAAAGLVLAQEFQVFMFTRAIDDSQGGHQISIPHTNDLCLAIRDREGGVSDKAMFRKLLRRFEKKTGEMF